MATEAVRTVPEGTVARGAFRARRVRKFAGDWLPVAPFMLLAGGLLVASAGWLVILSVRSDAGVWSLDAWQQIFRPGRVYRGAIVNSLVVSVWTCSICTVVGTPLAWYVHNLSGKGKAFAIALTNTAANFVGVSLARAFVATLGAAGFVTLLLDNLFGYQLGDLLYSRVGLVAIFCYFTLPLYVLLVLPAMAAVRPAWWEAVQVASGGRWLYWRRVGIPVLAPFVASGWVLTFAWTMGQYAVPAALLGSQAEPRLITLRIGDLVGVSSVFGSQSQQAAAYAVLLMAIATAALGCYTWLARRPRARLEGS